AFFACVAAGLLSVDGEHFVHSRTSLLDIILMAFVLLAFYFVLLDREQTTKRLANWSKGTSTTSMPTPAEATTPQPRPPRRPRLQPRPPRRHHRRSRHRPPRRPRPRPRPPRPHLPVCGSVVGVGTR